MLIYNFKIHTYDVGVKVQQENEYHVSLDGVYAGIIYSEFIDELPFMVWKTRDLIAEDLVQKTGAVIQQSD